MHHYAWMAGRMFREAAPVNVAAPNAALILESR
jgi:hypothetical protein